MSDSATRITIEKYDHHGHFLLRYPATRVLFQTPTTICVEAFFDFDLPSAYVNIDNGDRVVEWFFTDRWYNIMEYHAVGDDHLKGWYCNITRPSQILVRPFDNLTITWDDLALDVFIYPDGRFLLLDEDELDALTLPPVDLAQIWAAVRHLRTQVEQRRPPFDVIPKP